MLLGLVFLGLRGEASAGKTMNARSQHESSRRQSDGTGPAGPFLRVSLILCFACSCGCSTVLRLPEGTIGALPIADQIDAEVSISSVTVVPATRGMGTHNSEMYVRGGPRRGGPRTGDLWYATGWSTINLDSVAPDVVQALKDSKLFLRGISRANKAADLEMALTLRMGCETSAGKATFSLLAIIGTLDVYPFLGGPFPVPTPQTEIICELAPADRQGPAKTYRSRIELDGWAPIYTMHHKEKKLTASAFTSAVYDIIHQIAQDKNNVYQVAQNVRTRRLSQRPPTQVAVHTVPGIQAGAAAVAPPSSSVGPIKGRWAVVIGISKYRDAKVAPLPFAAADAKALHSWLISPTGGKYRKDRVKLLLDEKATAAALRDVFFDWLKQPIAEDMVTIFFAGHGSPESPDNLNNLYLLPHDVDYNKMGATAFPMWDIETALKRHIKARRVVIIADACHSAGVGQQFDIARRGNRGLRVVPVTKSLQTVGAGVCILSASDTAQLSQEGKQWGGGHGVFSHYLLEGLKGKADVNKDASVTIGELVPYISEGVRRATRSAQCPQVSGKYDPAMAIGK